ncbi:MAG: sugar phosphate isomerase/epimerase [Firmicutes bacterium]|nr:sugar phosphate isomerase/epimerase [Bacillota bacterium]
MSAEGSMMMQIGVSTACLYPETTEQALDDLLRLGFRQFEFFFNSASELKPPYLREIERRMAVCGARAVSLHPFSSGIESTLFFSAYERRFADSVELYKPYFEAAAQIGAPLLVLHGDKAQAVSEQESFERFARLAEEALRFGVTLAQENVRSRRSASPDVIARMRSFLGERAAFVLDLKQAVLAGEDPLAMCRAMGSGLRHLHLNDFSEKNACLLPGQGTMEFGALFRLLQEQHFSGTAVIEVYRENFGQQEELSCAREWLESLLQKQSERQKPDGRK